MSRQLSVSEIRDFLTEAEETFRHDECKTCECFLGYIAQLEIDSGPDGRAFLQEYQNPQGEIHTCLGCDPCSPGILYSNYLRKRSSRERA